MNNPPLVLPNNPRLLLVGDPHAHQDELEDCQRLVDLICEQVSQYKPNAVVFLGDQHHNHSLVHLEVLSFWKNAFEKIKSCGTEIIGIVGNHDQSGNGKSNVHAMMAYAIAVADKVLVFQNFACISHCSTEQEFRQLLSELPLHVKTVFCHQTFDGAKYENGFYAKDGFSLAGLERYEFISGHIHAPSQFNNVTYVGSPRWRGVSDANVERFLWCVESFSDGVKMVGKIETSLACEPFFHYVDRQEAPHDLNSIHLSKGRIVVDLYGSADWISERIPKWGSARIRTFPSTQSSLSVKESLGVEKALYDFVDGFSFSKDLTKEEFVQAVEYRLKDGDRK